MKTPLAALAAACLVFQTSTAVFAEHIHSDYSSPSEISYEPTNRQIVDSSTSRYASYLSDSGYKLICQGNLVAAENLLKQAVALDPNHFAAQCNLGYVLNKTGRAKDALPHLLYAFYSFPEEPAVVPLLAGTYQLLGNLPAAIQLCRLYISRFPGAPNRDYMAAITRHLIAESTEQATKNYNWTKKNVRVFIHPGSGLQGYREEFEQVLKESFSSWSQAGVLTFEFVRKPDRADIECVWTDDVKQLGSLAEGGEAVLNHQGNAVSHARIMLLTNRNSAVAAMSLQEMRALCLHEIGHSLGMMRHSRNPSDVMYFTVAATATPSSSDIMQLQRLYTH